VRNATVWAGMFGVEKSTVIDGVEVEDESESIVVSVRPRKGAKQRCGQCQRRCPRYDHGEGRRRWRGPDLGLLRSFLEADAPRVTCPTHGVVVASVPWARHGARHTRVFEDTVAWMAPRTSKSTLEVLLRIAWRTVGAIVTRVVAEGVAARDPLQGLRRIGIDEISYKKGHRYITIVVDHDTGRLVWAAPGRDRKTLNAFFTALGESRCAAVTHVSADAAQWIADEVALHCPYAIRCADAFHIVAWAGDALDQVRRDTWNAARKGGMSVHARDLKGSRYALWKNPENLTSRQQAKLAWVAKVNHQLFRAYLLKEQLREVFALKGEEGKQLLDSWLGWAQRCRIPSFVQLGRRISKHREAIDATLDHRLSNGLVESTNTKIRLLTRIAFGFKSPEAMISLAMLNLGGYCPPLPGRQAA
jgi:transposase